MSSTTASADQSTRSVELALEHARVLLTTDPDLALMQLDEIEHVVGKHPTVMLLRSRAYAAQARYEEAEALLQQLRQVQPKWLPPVLEIAQLFSVLKKYPEALEQLQFATKAQPRYPGVWLRLADHCRICGDHAAEDHAYQQHVAKRSDKGVIRAYALHGHQLLTCAADPFARTVPTTRQSPT